jgi:hypothetical protein
VKKVVTILLIISAAFLSCSDEPSAPEEEISQPAMPTGDQSANLNESKIYKTGGTKSNLGHAVVYRFDVDADSVHQYTAWSSIDSVSASWPDAGSYSVKAQARCAEHTKEISPWSSGLRVAVAAEIISTPELPGGPTYAWPAEADTFCTSGASSSKGHLLEFQFDFDADGVRDTTMWDIATCVENAWPVAGAYVVKSRARCRTHNGAVSEWSDGKTVAVDVEVVSTPDEPSGPSDVPPGPPVTYCAVSAASNKGHILEYQFDFDAAGAGGMALWDTTRCVDHTWSTEGFYDVKVRARCAAHTDIVSQWSAGKTVAFDAEIITTPDKPSGFTHTWPNVPETYQISDGVSSKGHQLAYQFDFDAAGAGNMTAWDTLTTVTHAWPTIGTYVVNARARCATHTQWVSPWSEGETITVTEVTELPEIRFATEIRGIQKPYIATAALDTVGYMKPFQISYHGSTINRGIIAYKFFPLSTGITIPGADLWTTDLSDTIRVFNGPGEPVPPSGIIRLAAQCRDASLSESLVNAGTFEDGVCQVVVNFDPDTDIFNVSSSYTINNVVYGEIIDFTDGIPDTVPYNSWVRLDYHGWDDDRDQKSLCNDLEPDRCIGFQVAYTKDSDRVPGAHEFSLWQPRDGVHDTDPYSSTDSNTFHIGSLEYDLHVRAIDEHGRPDGTPPDVYIIGNFDPTLDSVAVEDHLGNRIDLSILDTVTWNFWKGEGWPYVCQCDTVDFQETFCDPVDCQGRTYPDNGGTFEFYKTFSVSIKAWGHDHPKDPTGSAVKAWRYFVKNNQDEFVDLGKSVLGWFDGVEVDVLDDVIRWRVLYPGPFSSNPDPMGDTVFDNVPSWIDNDLTFFLMGRDMANQEGEFVQSIFINGQESIINVFPTGMLGRWTEERVFSFRIQLVR